MIVERFGERVAEIVNDVTEQDRSLTWTERKQEALAHVPQFSHESLLVKSADLIANISEMISDFYVDGESIFERFSGEREKMLSHYENMVAAVLAAWPENPLADDLRALDINSMR